VRSGFGQWLVANRVARIGLIAALLPLPVTSVLSASMVVALSIAKGWRLAAVDCLVALVLLGIFTMVAGGAWQQAALSAVSTWSAAMLLGGLTGVFGSLIFSLQALIMICVLGLIGFTWFANDPVIFWESVLEKFAEQMSELGMPLADPTAVLDLAPIMSGLVAASVVTSSTLALLIGAWWAGGAKGTDFRTLFVNLRLGYVVGGIAVIAGLGAAFGVSPLAGNVMLVLGVGFVFQGLAVIHWLVGARGLPWMLLIPVYLPFFMGASILVMGLLMLASIGFVDNWYCLRRFARSEP
jgi:hypothetical protein